MKLKLKKTKRYLYGWHPKTFLSKLKKVVNYEKISKQDSQKLISIMNKMEVILDEDDGIMTLKPEEYLAEPDRIDKLTTEMKKKEWKVYRIVFMTSSDVYYGMTRQTLSQRLSGHLSSSKRDPTLPLASFLTNNRKEDIKIELIKICESEEEARITESNLIILDKKCLNSKISTTMSYSQNTIEKTMLLHPRSCLK